VTRDTWRLRTSWLFTAPTIGRRRQSPDLLHKALLESHSLITAWDGDRLVGLGNSLSDGHLVVYYSHLLVLPEYQGRGIGTRLMQMLMSRYAGFHQQILAADGRAIDFYRKFGFTRAGKTEPMWIYEGHDHAYDALRHHRQGIQQDPAV
jgi:ribosomal protein S18 acetylase RimI-like enzyme